MTLLLVGAMASLTIAPAVLAKNEINKGSGWQAMSRPEVLGTVTAISDATLTIKK